MIKKLKTEIFNTRLLRNSQLPVKNKKRKERNRHTNKKRVITSIYVFSKQYVTV